MKKIYTFIITLTLLIFSAATGYAWDINSRELGISFTISNEWTQNSYSSEFPSFVNSSDSGEKISFEIYNTATFELYPEDCRDLCSNRYSNKKLSTDLSKANNTLVSVNEISSWEKNVTYNGVEYFNYVKKYKASASDYSASYGLKSAFITIQNGKGYLIEYSLFTSNPDTIDSKYDHAEIFRLLKTLSYEPGEIKIFINNNQIKPDSAPIIVDGRTIVPIRAIAEALGYEVSWTAELQTVTLLPPDDTLPTLVLKVGNAVMLENYSEEIELEVAPVIINDRTYLPLRAISEAMSAIVDWDPVARAVVIWK